MKISTLRRPLHFHKNYFLLALSLLLIEILIASFVHDAFIRPYVGDFLVVILIYCFIKSFLNTPVVATAVFVLLFACAIETAQYFDLAGLLGLQHSRIAKVILGSSFEWKDVLAYTCGIGTELLGEVKAFNWQ